MKTPSSRFAIYTFLSAVICVTASASSIEDLSDPDYAVRQAATAALMLDDEITTGQLAAWYALAESPEAEQRLLTIARHRMLVTLRNERFPADGPGVLGIVPTLQSVPAPSGSKKNTPATKCIVVTRVLDGFPAAGRLEPLDRLIAINDQPLDAVLNIDRFGDLIRRYPAGQEIKLTVIRSEQTLEVAVPLANGNALQAMYATPGFGLSPEFDRAWTEHRDTHFTPPNPSR
ncbi:MAG: PDZ domain-containing protein [Planctomycetota bacterium]